MPGDGSFARMVRAFHHVSGESWRFLRGSTVAVSHHDRSHFTSPTTMASRQGYDVVVDVDAEVLTSNAPEQEQHTHIGNRET